MRAEKRNVRGAPLTSASASQHRRPAPGDRARRANDAQLPREGDAHGRLHSRDRLDHADRDHEADHAPRGRHWSNGDVRTFAAVALGVTVAVVFAESLA